MGCRWRASSALHHHSTPLAAIGGHKVSPQDVGDQWPPTGRPRRPPRAAIHPHRRSLTASGNQWRPVASVGIWCLTNVCWRCSMAAHSAYTWSGNGRAADPAQSHHVPFCSTLSYSVLLRSILFYSVLFCSILINSVRPRATQRYAGLSCSTMLYSEL